MAYSTSSNDLKIQHKENSNIKDRGSEFQGQSGIISLHPMDVSSLRDWPACIKIREGGGGGKQHKPPGLMKQLDGHGLHSQSEALDPH